jgi:hypothetical protein
MTDEPVNTGVPQKRGLLGWVTRNSKAITALSAAAIPVVLAGLGYVTTKAINDQNLDKEYVNLAIEILGAEFKTQQCSVEEREAAVPELKALARAQTDPSGTEENNLPDDSGDGQAGGEASLVEGLVSDLRDTVSLGITNYIRADAQKDFDKEISRTQIEQLVGTNGERALRGYALGLLTGATPFGVELDKQQYVALLCGDVSVVDLNESSSEIAVTSTVGGAELTSDELSRVEAALLASLRDGAEDESEGAEDESEGAEDKPDAVVLEMLDDGCQLLVRQTIREIAGDDAGEFPPSLLPVGLYTVVERLSWKSGEAPEQLEEAFVQLTNGNWIRTRVRVAELNDPKVC